MSDGALILRIIELELGNLRTYLEERLASIQRSEEIDRLRADMDARFSELSRFTDERAGAAVEAAETAAAVAIDAAEAATEAAEEAAEEAEEAEETSEEESEDDSESEPESTAETPSETESEREPERAEEEITSSTPSRQSWYHKPL